MTEYQPQHLKLWTRPDHYHGAVWPAYYSSSVGQSRDSDALERSNFECMLKALGGESDTVIVVCETHWAVGWVEWIAIHQDDGAALKTADDLRAKLNDYPVINESHWCELENDEAQELWRTCFNPHQRVKYIREYRSQFEFADFADLIGCVRGNYFAGYASELLS